MPNVIPERSIEGPVNDICDDFQRRTGIAVSPHSRDLITLSLDAVLNDPHPSWAATAGNVEARNTIVRFYLDRLPQYLSQVTEQEKVSTLRITYFHLMHWLSTALGGICIIQK